MSLLEQVKEHGNPIIDGTSVTFVWRGKKAPCLVDDLHFWDENPQPLAKSAPGVWSISFELPANAYLEYAFLDVKTGQRLPDAFNHKTAYNGVGGHNHYFYMPQAEGPTALARPRPGGLRGWVSRHTVPTEGFACGRERRVYLYHPPVKEPVPLLVVYDGLDYLRRGRLAEIVDNLIAEKRMRPVAVAFAENGGEGRAAEYCCSEATLLFLQRQVLPLASREANVVDHEKQPGVHGILGSSAGGIMAMFTGLRLPHIFGKVFAQSGSYQLWEHETNLFAMVRHQPSADLRIWLDVGMLEWPWLLESNRRMHSLLRERGYDVSYREFVAGHCFTAWRNCMWRGLETLLAP
jgi:enterochelin esterase-like enzyme